MNELVEIEILVLELLLIVSVVAIVVRRFRIPYTVALVIAGLVLSFRSPLGIELTSELILSLLIPPLVFEAAFHLNLSRLRENYRTIVLLAVPGVLLSMVLVGGVVHFGGGLSLGSALIFGALIAATDPVSVVAIFRKLGAPKRLEVLLEGESLFNDGTAIVVFNLAVVAVVAGRFSVVDGLIDFLTVSGGGLLVGGVLGWLTLSLLRRIDDHLVETTLTTVLAFGAYLLAEQLHVSGVLAVVAAGLINGNIGPEGMSPTTRIVVLNFWEYVAFLANSAVFLLIGLDLEVPALVANWQPVLWAIAGVLLARAIGIYGLSRLGKDMPHSWRHVMFWGGLRGAIALALALSLPSAVGGERQTMIVMTFAVVLFTLLVQGLSMDWLVHRLKLIVRSEEQIEYERRHARALAAQASYDHLRDLHGQGLVSSHTWRALRPVMERRVDGLTGAVQEVLRSAPELEVEEMATARRESLRAQRSMLATLRRDGVISDETYEELVAEVDLALDSGVEFWARSILVADHREPIKHVVTAVIQQRDFESANNAMALRGVPTTRIDSIGGFLGQPNHILLVGIPAGKLRETIEALRNATQQRVEFLTGPLTDGDAPAGRPVEISGAIVFVLDVDRYEEF
ncbi:MAG TPA: Na+/H+ antiporter [Anaerolineales bacterium]|jgi:CPA1 family monovalent cation:H+ antiporter